MIPDGEFSALYPYGSRIYGTAQRHSDYDFVGIKSGINAGDMERGLISVKLMDPDHFQRLVNEHRPSALECLFLPDDLISMKPTKPWDFKLSLPMLRHSFSQKASNSFVKAKKKFVAPYEWANKERMRGKKSLFHSLRILKFGIQIAKHGKIVDYSEANDIFEGIMKLQSDDWEDFRVRWKPEYNQLCTEFRKLAPKE